MSCGLAGLGLLKQLEKQQRALQRKKNDIEEQILREQYPERKKLVGKCFGYRNSYGHGAHWWLYLQVVSVEKNSEYLTCEMFEKDCNGKIFWDTKYLAIVKSLTERERYETMETERYEEVRQELLDSLRRQRA